ncbi:MAG: ABC transporter substrate-binding protein [Tannerellaceae bacterium]|jgi:iron complex transport system substrate-binding protein|nr:ABC transporter substrate-binding protein [Tannerellaceae bacterium]
MKQYLLIVSVCLVAACGQPGKPSGNPVAGTGAAGNYVAADTTTAYAKGFSIKHHDGYTVVEVSDPWDTTRLLQRYVLVDRNKPLPSGLPRGAVVRTPLRNVVVYTSVHASIIEELGEAGSIAGVCEAQYINSPALKARIDDGRIASLGMSTAPNIEKMIEIGAECIIASPFQNTGYGQAGKLGIPIIEAADYMEPHPLGRAEWGLFYGLLFGREDEAAAIFSSTEESYLALCDLALTADGRPTVISEKRYGSFWYVPEGDSYMAHFFRDAGAEYVFGHIPGEGSSPLVFETVLDRAGGAGFWLIKYNREGEMSYKDLKAEYSPYAYFDAFKKRSIYTCNTNYTPYYEETPMHPDYLLKDLIWIFHPDLLPYYTPRYYRKMADN